MWINIMDETCHVLTCTNGMRKAQVRLTCGMLRMGPRHPRWNLHVTSFPRCRTLGLQDSKSSVVSYTSPLKSPECQISYQVHVTCGDFITSCHSDTL
jgi:hypothetical protein